MDAYINELLEGKCENTSETLQKFVDNALQIFHFPELDENNKRKQLWAVLFELAQKSIDKKTLANCFISARILSREKKSLNELITEDWFELIKTHSGLNNPAHEFTEDNLLVAIEVEKFLCNLAFNSSVAAAMCCKNGIVEELCERVARYEESKLPNEVQFFDVKLIFLLTALCSEVRNRVMSEMGGIVSLVKLMDAVLKDAAAQPNPIAIKLSGEKADLVSEILKALFNLTLNYYGDNDNEKENEQCAHLVSILKLYLLMPVDDKEKACALQNNIINLLTNIPPAYYVQLITPITPEQKISSKFQFEGQNMTAFYEILKFLESKFAIESPGVTKQHEILSPVITVLLKSVSCNRAIRKYLKWQILPPLKDVHQRPEQGNTLRNHLCRLLTTPITQLRDLVADLLFILCKKSVKRMIKYTGYGNAAGLFAKRGLLGGKSDKEEADYSSDSGNSETEEYAEFKHGINPVIGCYEEPHPDPMENMTEEQKEYEAMKLVELMDSLTKCGAIQPCRVGADGKPHPIEHVLQLQEGLKNQQINDDSDCD